MEHASGAGRLTSPHFVTVIRCSLSPIRQYRRTPKCGFTCGRARPSGTCPRRSTSGWHRGYSGVGRPTPKRYGFAALNRRVGVAW